MEKPIYVLYVDDNPLDRALVRDALDQEADTFVLREASSREEFETLLKQQTFDVVLSDFNILGYEGLQVIATIKGRYPDLPVIIVTGTGSEEIAVAALHAGADDYVIKSPSHIQRLPATIRLVLEKHQLKSAKEKAELALRQREISYRELVEHANSIILRLDPQGRITFFNEFAEKFFGYPASEILGQPCVGTIVPETDSYGYDLRAKIADLLRNPEKYPASSNENRRRNGERVWISWTNKAIRDAKGRLLEILCIGNDITELRQVQEAFADLVNHAPIGIFIAQEGCFRLVNPAFPRLTGYREDELIGKKAMFLVAPDFRDLVRHQARLILQGKQATPLEFQIIDKAGRRRWIMQFIAPTKFTGQRAILGYCMDVTEQRELAAQFLQAQKLESVGRLAGGVAHDFNNILGAILGYAEMGLIEENLPDNVRLYLEEIRTAVNKSTNLVRQLLAFARKQVINPEVVDLNDAVASMLKILQRLIGEDIELIWKPGHNLWKVKIDPSQVDQILANLMVNSRDAIAGVGRILIETANITLDDNYCRTRPECSPGDYVQLTVSDTGCGMSTETLSHIFEPFFTTKDSGLGTGLGLATVYGIIKQNGGFINVYSEVGQGTTFRIYLPRLQEEEVVRQVAAVEATIPRGQEVILLVEDDEAMLQLGRVLLERLGYKVLMARLPSEALHLAATYPQRIDLLITDVIMPEMNGLELSRRLTAELPHLKSLFISGYTADIIAHRGVLPPGVQFLQKPFTLHDLAQTIRRALAS